MKQVNLNHTLSAFVLGVVFMFVMNIIVFQPVKSRSQAMSLLSETGSVHSTEGELMYVAYDNYISYYELYALAKLSGDYVITISNEEEQRIRQDIRAMQYESPLHQPQPIRERD